MTPSESLNLIATAFFSKIVQQGLKAVTDLLSKFRTGLMRQTVEILLNLIEKLQLKVKDLESENQRLKDENNRLKGEQGKPDIKAKSKGSASNHSSEKERKTVLWGKYDPRQVVRVFRRPRYFHISRSFIQVVNQKPLWF
jgi:regulator of replication initiation timing